MLLAGCADRSPPAEVRAIESNTPAQPPDARAQLAALAAAAQDRHLSAIYTLVTEGRPDRTVTVTSATDRTWRVDIPGGALGGAADVSVARTRDGMFQCSLPSAHRPEPSTCVRVAEPGDRLASDIDPRVQHPFVDWPGVLTDRQAPLAVSIARPPAGGRGTCFSVESTSASVSPSVDVGIYCYAADGTLTAARLEYGTLVLVGTAAAAPSTIALPGPVIVGEPLGMAARPEVEPTDTSPDPSIG